MNDLMGGAAGNGLFLVRLWEATGDSQHFDGAIRCGAWLADQMKRDERGSYCLTSTNTNEWSDIPTCGVPHGNAGIAHYFLVLYEATKDERWAGLAREILNTLVDQAVPDKGGLNWGMVFDGPIIRCQWSHGSPGIGLVFLKASELFNDASYYDIALKCGEATYGWGDIRSNATHCIDLTGNGELFIELYQASGEKLWLDRAHEFAGMALGYRTELPEGDVWPTDAPGLWSADYMIWSCWDRTLLPEALEGGSDQDAADVSVGREVECGKRKRIACAR